MVTQLIYIYIYIYIHEAPLKSNGIEVSNNFTSFSNQKLYSFRFRVLPLDFNALFHFSLPRCPSYQSLRSSWSPPSLQIAPPCKFQTPIEFRKLVLWIRYPKLKKSRYWSQFSAQHTVVNKCTLGIRRIMQSFQTNTWPIIFAQHGQLISQISKDLRLRWDLQDCYLR